jgi:hypothetical protein
MKAKILKFSVFVIISFIMGINIYNAQPCVQLSDAQLENVEALAYGEEWNCMEWVKKNCYTDFSLVHGPNYYATCAGEPSVLGGMMECGAVKSELPLSPVLPLECLQCIKTF